MKPGLIVHICNPSTQEAKAGGSLWVQAQPELRSEFKASSNYIDNLSIQFKSSRIYFSDQKNAANEIYNDWNQAYTYTWNCC